MSENLNMYKPVVLIVDDVPENLQVLYKILSQEGYSFSIATNGAETFNVLEKQKPDLILLDVMLPDTDGYEICRKIKNSEKNNDIPIIFLTAKNDSDDKIKAFDIGGVDFITKPFEEIEVLRKVSTQIQLQRLKELSQKYSNEDVELDYWINK